MTDLATMLWKEAAEFLGNPRFFRVFAVAVLAMGILPALAFSGHRPEPTGVVQLFRVVYALFATLVVVAQTAPDLVLHERVGHTLDYLLTTRLPTWVLFGAKMLAATALGYVAGMLALGLQLVVAALLNGTGWHWLFLAMPVGRVAAFGLTLGLSLYVAAAGTLVALRVGEQRAAYMVTMLTVGIPIVPVAAGWIAFEPTAAWVGAAAAVVGGVGVAAGLAGLAAFRREMLVLYLQE